MKDGIIAERLGADAMKSIAGGDMRSIATAWEARATDENATNSIATGWEARATDPNG